MNLTPKQEAFCLAYMETGNASEAYRQAYDAGGMTPVSINRKAKELIDNGKIAARLSTLRERAVERTLVTVESIAAELDEARALALSAEVSQPSAAISASMGKAKLYGLIIDKKLLGSDPDNPLPTGIDVTFRK